MKKSVFEKIARVMMVALMAAVCMTFMTACGDSDDDPLENTNPVNNNTNNGGNNGSGGQASQNGVTYPNLWTALGASYDTVIDYAKSNGFKVEEEMSSLEFVYMSNADGSLALIYGFDWNGEVSKMKRLYVYWMNTTLADAEWIRGEVEKAFKVTLDDDPAITTKVWSYMDSKISLAVGYVADSRVTTLLYGYGYGM